ncbi:diacylglycerol kinase, partial [Sinorhizobium medicae]
MVPPWIRLNRNVEAVRFLNSRDEMDAKNTNPRKGAAGPVTKHTGFRHLFAAASYSFGGARRLIGEAAFRHELIAFAVAMAAFATVGANLFQYVAMAILFLLMMAFEAINTAIEEIVDRVSPEISEMGRNAKDLGSFACL